MRPQETFGHDVDLQSPAGVELQPTPPEKTPKSARQIVWTRRRRALLGVWRTYKRNRKGMAGLLILGRPSARRASTSCSGPTISDDPSWP